MLVQHDAETGRAVAECRHEDRHVLVVAGLDEAIVLLAVLGEVAAHLADDFAAGVGARLEAVEDGGHGVVADAQFVFIDVVVVDAVDRQLAQLGVVDELCALVVAEAQALEEVLVHHDGAGADDGVHHVVVDQVNDHLLQARADQAAGQAQHHTAVLVAQGHVVDVGRA